MGIDSRTFDPTLTIDDLDDLNFDVTTGGGMRSLHKQTSPRRRRFQVSLRTLFLAVTLACGCFGLLSLRLQAVQKQRQAVESIEKLGGNAWFDYQFDGNGNLDVTVSPPGPVWASRLLGDEFFANVRQVRVYAVPDFELKPPRTYPFPLDDDWLSHVRAFPRLRDLELASPNITDAGFIHLQDLSQLTQLSIQHAPIEGNGMLHLRGLTRLEALNFDWTRLSDVALVNLQPNTRLTFLSAEGTKIGDAGLAHLAKFPALAVLDLSRTCVSGTGLVHLQSLSRLEQLALRAAPITADGWTSLGTLHQLIHLDLSCTGINGDGIAHLQGLMRLKSLCLNGTSITDEALDHLESHSALVTLELRNTLVSHQRCKALQKLLPHLNIDQ
jgi:hypothetical protein